MKDKKKFKSISVTSDDLTTITTSVRAILIIQSDNKWFTVLACTQLQAIVG